MKCPGCKADVDADQDFCMDCGEPIAGMQPASQPARAPAPVAAPVAAPIVAKPVSAKPAAAKPAVKRRRNQEPEPIRCPGCGTPTLKVRCGGCGIKLREDDEE